jgi:hypothetical protein
MLIILAETLHGAVRELFIAPQLGALRARQLGVPAGCLLVFVIALLTSRWLDAGSRIAQLRVGAFWVVSTVLFEVILGRALGLGWDRILSDYNPARGGFMIGGLAFMFFAPLLAARLRNRRSPKAA